MPRRTVVACDKHVSAAAEIKISIVLPATAGHEVGGSAVLGIGRVESVEETKRGVSDAGRNHPFRIVS